MIHIIENGFCTVCNETEEWLVANPRSGDEIRYINFSLSTPEV